jgi:hypothetical protein
MQLLDRVTPSLAWHMLGKDHNVCHMHTNNTQHLHNFCKYAPWFALPGALLSLGCSGYEASVQLVLSPNAASCMHAQAYFWHEYIARERSTRGEARAVMYNCRIADRVRSMLSKQACARYLISSDPVNTFVPEYIPQFTMSQVPG